jgi:hypothetical protein
MPEKYDLDQMLREIEEDETEDLSTKKEKLSQDDIHRLIEKRRNSKSKTSR